MAKGETAITFYDTVVIGAGAAGLMAAIESGKRGRSVLVVDHADSIGKKLRISGGGCCNFSNIAADHHNYISRNPRFCKSALARFSAYDFITMLEKHGIAYEEREQGQLFCVKSSLEIIKMLSNECSEAGARVILNCNISCIGKEQMFSIITDKGAFASASLVTATGGLSYPRLGATALGYEIAGQFGINVIERRPALVPFVLNPPDSADFSDLSGVSFDALVRCSGKEFQGGILFTHRGLSGPAILQVSSYWNPGDAIAIDIVPGINMLEVLALKHNATSEIPVLLCQFLPRRFARYWCERYGYSGPICRYNKKELTKFLCHIHNWEVIPVGTEGYSTAEVTAGGIDTDELSSKTMESRKVRGLYFAGEVIDVTGQLGGYNLQWAWSSGFAAGQYA